MAAEALSDVLGGAVGDALGAAGDAARSGALVVADDTWRSPADFAAAEFVAAALRRGGAETRVAVASLASGEEQWTHALRKLGVQLAPLVAAGRFRIVNALALADKGARALAEQLASVATGGARVAYVFEDWTAVASEFGAAAAYDLATQCARRGAAFALCHGDVTDSAEWLRLLRRGAALSLSFRALPSGLSSQAHGEVALRARAGAERVLLFRVADQGATLRPKGGGRVA